MGTPRRAMHVCDTRKQPAVLLCRQPSSSHKVTYAFVQVFTHPTPPLGFPLTLPPFFPPLS